MTTLFIDPSESRCGACGKSADPYSKTHAWVYGYTPGPGCGAVYDSVSSHYMDYARLYLRIQDMRPDLIFLDPMEAL